MWGEIIKQIETLAKKVEARGSGFDVVHCHGEDKGKSLGHHDTKEEAMAQHRAIEASKHAKKSIENYLEKNGKRPAAELSTTVPLPASTSRPSDESKPSPGRAAGVSYESSAPEPAKIASCIKEYVEKQEAPKAPRKPPTDRPQADLPASEAFPEYTKPGSGFGKDTAKMIKEYLEKQFPSAANVPISGAAHTKRAVTQSAGPKGPPESSGSNLPHPTSASKPVEATAKPQTPPKPRGGDTRPSPGKYGVMPKWGREILD